MVHFGGAGFLHPAGPQARKARTTVSCRLIATFMSKRTQAAGAMALVVALWGATFVVVKEALGSVSVFVFLFLRFGLAALVMAVMYRPAVRRLQRSEVRAGAEIGFFLFGGYALQSAGLLFTTPSKSAFITGSAVVMVPVILFAFWRQRVHPGVWWGTVSALAGLYLVTVPPGSGLGQVSELNPGDPLTLVGAAMFALHIVFIGRYSDGHSVGALSFVQVATAAVLSLVALPVFHYSGWEPARLAWNMGLVVAIVITGVFCTAIGFSVQVWSQRYLAPAHTGLLITLEPVFAAITSYLLLSERLSGRTLLGSGLILVAILLAELKGPAQTPIDSPCPMPREDS